MTKQIGPKPPPPVQTAAQVVQRAASQVVQALAPMAQPVLQDTFTPMVRPLVVLGEVVARLPPPQYVVQPDSGLVLRAGPNGTAGPTLPKGTVVTELSWPDNVPLNPDWMYVSYQDGDQLRMGFVHRDSLRIRIDEPEYTDTRTRAEVDAARDGTVGTAMDWARFLENASTTGYDDLCLKFCFNAYNLHTGSRCPEMTGVDPGDAINAFTALETNGKIRPLNGEPNPHAPLEAGAIVFFDAGPKNNEQGHVCIATGRMAPDGTPEVITSGFPPNHSGVHYSSVGSLEQLSGPYIGYTTPEIAFEDPPTAGE